MGTIIGFSQLSAYLNRLDKSDPVIRKATILDTNILITFGYEIRNDHESVTEVLDLLSNSGYRFLATVNTKSEFLEFHRRLQLTEGILDMAEDPQLRVSRAARAKIHALKGSLSTSVGANPERDRVFNDNHLKKIKKEFSAGAHSGQIGWLEICDAILAGHLSAFEQELLDSDVEYVSQNDPSQFDLFHAKIDWSGAITISEKSGASFSDSMILNAFQCSYCPFIVSMDFDVGYAVLSDPLMKDAVMPDQLANEYRHYLF